MFRGIYERWVARRTRNEQVESLRGWLARADADNNALATFELAEPNRFPWRASS